MNKKYILLAIMFSVILVGTIAIAEDLIRKDVNIGAERATALAEVGITNPIMDSIQCNSEFCWTKVHQDGGMIIPTIKIRVTATMTTEEIQSEIDREVTKTLTRIADNRIAMRNKRIEDKGGASIITIR